MSHATPQDTLAALRTRYEAQIEKAVLLALRWEGYLDQSCALAEKLREDENGPNAQRGDVWDMAISESTATRESVPRDARLKLALLDQVERRVLSEDELQGICLPDDEVDLTRHEDALSLLRLLAESAGEAVAW